MNIKIFNNFTDTLEYSKTISSFEKDILHRYLIQKWSIPEIIGDINILEGSSLLFLLIVNTLETLGRTNDTGCTIARDYLKYLKCNNEQFFKKIGIEDCVPYLHECTSIEKFVPALSYNALGKHYQDLIESETNTNIIIDRAVWQAVYLIVHAIYQKDERFASTWYQAVMSFYNNSVLENCLVAYVPGLSFFNRGVRHDKFCPVSGTADPDFWYTTDVSKVSAEFKQATKTVEALARYSYNNPNYIYNAKVLFTYGKSSSGALGFYKIDYTCVPYIITAVEVDIELIKVIKAVGDKSYESFK